MDRLRRMALALLALSACSPKPFAGGLGQRLVATPARGLRASPDGGWLAYLTRCARPPVLDLPHDVLSCDLEVVPADGGAPTRVAEGVTSLPVGFAWAQDGVRLAALADYDYAAGQGALVVWAPHAGRQRLSSGVAFYGFSPRGELAYVAAGQLFLSGAAGGEPAAVAGATGIATFEFAPSLARHARTKLVARRGLAAGGDLFAISDRPVRLASAVADYRFSPSGELAYTARSGADYELCLAGPPGGSPPQPLGHGVNAFEFSHDGGAIAFLAGAGPGKPGDLLVARLGRGEPVASKVATAAGEFRWARSAARLAWLQAFDPRVRAGTLAAGGPGIPPVVLGRNVTSFALSPEGTRLAWLEHGTAGGYSVDLRLGEARPGARAETVALGVFGFDFSPDGKSLYYRTACVRNAEACDLYAVPAGGLAGGDKPLRVAAGVKSFEFDRRDSERLLIGWARQDRVALDLGVWQEGKLVAVDQMALPGSAIFLPPDSKRIGYVVADPRREGVYVAQLRH